MRPNRSYIRRSSVPVSVAPAGPDEEAPTDRTFFARAGVAIVQDSRPAMVSWPPKFPAAKIRRFSGFCQHHRIKERVSLALLGERLSVMGAVRRDDSLKSL